MAESPVHGRKEDNEDPRAKVLRDDGRGDGDATPPPTIGTDPNYVGPSRDGGDGSSSED